MRYQFDFNEPRGYVSAGPSSLYWALDTIHTASAKCCFHSRSTQLELNVLECDTISIELYSLEDFEIVSRLININELLSISHRYNWTAQDVLSTPNTEIRWIEWATVTSAHTHTHTLAQCQLELCSIRCLIGVAARIENKNNSTRTKLGEHTKETHRNEKEKKWNWKMRATRVSARNRLRVSIEKQ